MRKLQVEDAEVRMLIAIQQEIARSEESRYDHRLHGLLLVTTGQSCGSLKLAGSYTPSSSRISVLARAQISSRRCQSALFLARRETSSAMTIPVRHRSTSLTNR